MSARCFVRADGANRTIAVTMLNEAAVEGATIDVDLAPIGNAVRAHLFHLDGRVTALEPERRSKGNFTIPVPAEPISCAVLCAALAPGLRVHAWLEQVRKPGSDGVVLNLYAPLGFPKELSWKLEPPPGVPLDEIRLPAATPGWKRIVFADANHLTDWKRWYRLKAEVRWRSGERTAWTMAAPPLVNGDMEESEAGRLIYWGLPPCRENPASGTACLRLDKRLAKGGHVRQLAPLKPGVKYRFSCRIRRLGKGWAGAHVIEYEVGKKSRNAFRRSAVLNSTRTGTWETLETTFVSHPDPRTTAVYLYNGDARAPAFFDDIRLEEVRSAPGDAGTPASAAPDPAPEK